MVFARGLLGATPFAAQHVQRIFLQQRLPVFSADSVSTAVAAGLTSGSQGTIGSSTWNAAPFPDSL
jgi:hypothetical protein